MILFVAKILSTLDKSSVIAEDQKNDFAAEAKIAANNTSGGNFKKEVFRIITLFPFLLQVVLVFYVFFCQDLSKHAEIQCL